MYDKIGRKIKCLAKVMFGVEAVVAIVLGIVLMVVFDILIGLPVLILVPIVAWISSWLLYGFGEIIDKLCEIECNTRVERSQSKTKSQSSTERNAEIKALLSKGLITEEEYQQALSKE